MNNYHCEIRVTREVNLGDHSAIEMVLVVSGDASLLAPDKHGKRLYTNTDLRDEAIERALEALAALRGTSA